MVVVVGEYYLESEEAVHEDQKYEVRKRLCQERKRVGGHVASSTSLAVCPVGVSPSAFIW